MGDRQNRDLRVQFDRPLKLKFLGSKVTTDAGLLAYRELGEALGLTEMSEEVLTDSRLGSNKQHQLVPLLRQSVYSRLAGYEDVNDATGKAHQDRCQGYPAFSVCDIPTGRGRGNTEVVCGDPRPRRAVRNAAAIGPQNQPCELSTRLGMDTPGNRAQVNTTCVLHA